MTHITRVGIAVLVIAGALAAPSIAHANPNISDSSTCGLHAGKILRRDSGGTIYRMRIGVRMYHIGGSMMCRGYVRPPQSKGTLGGWTQFQLPSWHDFFNARIVSTDITTALTAYSCQTFGASLAATLVSEGAATPALVIGGIGCAWGVRHLKLPNQTVNLHGMPITAPRRRA